MPNDKEADLAKPVANAGRSVASLHEAGHGLARQSLLGDLTKVWVNDKGGGKSEHPRIENQNELDREYLAKTAIIIFVGIYVELDLVPPHPLVDRVIAADYGQARTVQKLGGFSDEEMEDFKRQAREFIATHEKEIRAVAKLLNLRGRLSGEQVKKIVERTQ
jgi:hypothetical protein